MNTGNLDKLATLLVHAPARGEAGEVLTEGDSWKEQEKMWLGEVQFGGRALPVGQREAAQVEKVYEGWFRPTVKSNCRLSIEGVTYNIERVDPKEGRQWMLVYVKVSS